jgi:hypothetical protein
LGSDSGVSTKSEPWGSGSGSGSGSG